MNAGFLSTPTATVSDLVCPRKALRTLNQKSFWKILSTFGDKCPRNGSKSDTMVPRTTLECPHEGPRVDGSSVAALCRLRSTYSSVSNYTVETYMWLSRKHSTYGVRAFIGPVSRLMKKKLDRNPKGNGLKTE